MRTSSPTVYEADLELARAGDHAAFTRLLAPLYPRAIAFYARRGVPHDVRQDLTQRAAMKAWELITSFRGDCSFEAWFFGILRSQLGMEHRRRASRSRLIEEAASCARMIGAKTSPACSGWELAHDLDAALAADQTNGPALVLAAQGYTMAEIGVVLGVDAEGAKSRLRRARALVNARVLTDRDRATSRLA